jgi:hypothetical protein
MENRLMVFVSSIISELWNEREVVRETLESIPLTKPWVFEYTPASTDNLDESYLSQVRECDIFILLIAGNISEPVKNEYETAVGRGKPKLVFLKDVERSGPAQAFVKQMDVKWDKFRDIQELRQKVCEAVVDELIKGYRRYRIGAGEVGKLTEFAKKLAGGTIIQQVAGDNAKQFGQVFGDITFGRD